MKQCIVIVFLALFVSCSFFKKGQVTFDYNSDIEYTEEFNEALKQKVIGNYSVAEELLLKCVRSKPDQAVNYYELSSIYLKLGETKQALSYGRKAIRYDKRNEWYYINLIKLYQLVNNPDSIILFYKEIVKLKPYKVEYKIKLANFYYENGYFKSSLRILKKIDGEKSIIGEVFLLRYKNYLALKNKRKSLETLKQAIKKLPYEGRFYGLLAEFYSSIGKNDLALSFYQKLLKIDPNNENGYLSLIEFYLSTKKYDVAFDFATEFLKNQDFAFYNKVELIRSYLNDNSYFDFTKDNILTLINNLGNIYPDEGKVKILEIEYYIKANNLALAKEKVSQALENSKNDEEVWERLFYILSLENDYKSIVKFSKDAIVYLKESPIVWLYYGVALYELKMVKDAVQVLNIGIKYSLQSKNLLEKYYSYLGECYNILREYSKSDFCFESAIKLNNKRYSVLCNYSYYLAQRNERLDKALVYIQDCLKAEPDNYKFLDAYAWILFKLNQQLEAKSVIEKAIASGGKSKREVIVHYCYILISLNNFDLAKTYYKSLKQIGFEDNQLKSILNE